MFIEPINEKRIPNIIEKLKNVFGIYSFSLAKKCSRDIEEIADAALSMIKEEDESKHFKVLARRSDKSYEMTSDEINRYVATKILKKLWRIWKQN